MTIRLLISVFLLIPVACVAAVDSLRLSVDMPVGNKGRLVQRLTFLNAVQRHISVELICKQIRNSTDSPLMYRVSFPKLKMKKGAGYIDLNFSKAAEGSAVHPVFASAILKLGSVPAGTYELRLRVTDTAHDYELDKLFILESDSVLQIGSMLRQASNKVFSSAAGSKGSVGAATATAQQLDASYSRLRRKLVRNKDITLVPVERQGRRYMAYYYKDWFVGYYEISASRTMSSKAVREESLLQHNPASVVTNELSGYRSLSSQFRDIARSKKQKDELKGNVELTSYMSSAMDPGAALDKDYAELFVNLDAVVLNLPVTVEGFYTTQDNNRNAKASYLRVHYDVNTAKARLQKVMDGYRGKLNETVSREQGLKQVYKGSISALQSERAKLINDFGKEYELDGSALATNKGDVNRMIQSLPAAPDTAQLADRIKGNKGTGTKKKMSLEEKKAKLESDKQRIAAQYARLQDLEEKMARYQTLLDQYQNQTALDSALHYQKIAALSGKDASYRQMSDAASGLIPEGRQKDFITGLTHFDLGIINQYQSDYTMAGQNLKGLSLGYDFGLFKTGIALGKTEYVSRDGQVDNYSTYLLRADMREWRGQKVGLIYTGYTPGREMLKDNNFTGGGVTMPSFQSPVHILSLVYDGNISDQLALHSEIAQSVKRGQSSVADMEHAAMKYSLAYNITKLGADVRAEWEHLGGGFENNTLPFMRTATDRYTIGAGMEFFRSFLQVKVDYNFFRQASFSGTGYSRKWGFDIRTRSRRYPSVAISYKPFATFRSFNDTLYVPQRPMVGAVWTGRTSYQFKHPKSVHRFSLTYNHSSSNGGDTFSYRSQTIQGSYLLSQPGVSFGATGGYIQLPVAMPADAGLQTSYTVGVMAEKALSRSVTVSAGEDLAFCNWGVQRLSLNAGVNWKMNRWPLTFRVLARQTEYRQSADGPKISLWAGQLGVNWEFGKRDDETDPVRDKR